MLNMQLIRDNPDLVKKACADKQCPVDIDKLLAFDERRRQIIGEAEGLKSVRNKKSQEIARLKKEKKEAEAAAVMAETKALADKVKVLDEQQKIIEDSVRSIAIWIPNIPHTSVPHGTSAADNVVVGEWGEAPAFDFPPKDHLQLGTALDIIDFPRGAKVAGTGFPVYKGAGALLERALINFMLDTHTITNGYCEIFPPFLVTGESLFGTGQLPKSQDQMYFIGEDELYGIPTAEVPVTNLHRDEMLDARILPIRYCAYSACFRREAGSYGKDTKGFLRVHQFNKIELVKFVAAQDSYTELESLRQDAEGVLKALGLKYRTLMLCDADLSFAAAKCYDLEAWAPAERKFLEVSSCSNFEDFQARRMNIRYRPGLGEKPRFVHTLNGSGVATARTLVAILETYQTASGSVRIPEVLQPYMHGMKEIVKG